ncbi:MAG: MerR family transcriptional regulator [Desulfovibrionaceae bacterium]
MSEVKLLSVAEIARRIDAPESTVHYWKNRFAQHLPSVGRGRQKRFRPEAVEVFAAIASLLADGHPVQEVMQTLAERFPLTPDTAPEPAPSYGNAPSLDMVREMAQTISREVGREMARALAEALRPGAALPDGTGLSDMTGGDAPALPGPDAETVAALQADCTKLKEKIEVMEAELVRLRRDRRELEKYLLDKIEKITT